MLPDCLLRAGLLFLTIRIRSAPRLHNRYGQPEHGVDVARLFFPTVFSSDIDSAEMGLWMSALNERAVNYGNKGGGDSVNTRVCENQVR
jgi:hypothetical protein